MRYLKASVIAAFGSLSLQGCSQAAEQSQPASVATAEEVRFITDQIRGPTMQTIDELRTLARTRMEPLLTDLSAAEKRNFLTLLDNDLVQQADSIITDIATYGATLVTMEELRTGLSQARQQELAQISRERASRLGYAAMLTATASACDQSADAKPNVCQRIEQMRSGSN